VSHHEETFGRVPAHVALPVDTALLEIQLLVRGQGTVGLTVDSAEGFTLVMADGEAAESAFRWSVEADQVVLSSFERGGWVDVQTVAGAGLDPEPSCIYWFSIDSHNRALRYGKGEMRLGAQLANHVLPSPPPGNPDPYAWLADLDSVTVDGPIAPGGDLWRDPVVIEPPLRVVPVDAITMDQVANAQPIVAVAANLTPACQILYANVSGKSFVLDSPDFSQFSAVIKRSINDEHGWCYNTLKAKAEEFGKPKPEETYLRITLGLNQGESPGVPFVMEIWPSGHYSPIHNHGGADAVIKVLHGAINVRLFAMLSLHHQGFFANTTFVKDEVTWISARLNQVHQLKNIDPFEPCITIQCYMYDETNLTHYPYFDYIGDSSIGQFTPNSDADFLTFKQLMRDEYERRPLVANEAVADVAAAQTIGLRAGPR
jgi:hypothetical protein